MVNLPGPPMDDEDTNIIATAILCMLFILGVIFVLYIEYAK